MNFSQWLAAVDRILIAHLGLGYSDLVDQCWRDMFDDGVTPAEAAGDIIADPYRYI